jgi:hypothetical protein
MVGSRLAGSVPVAFLPIKMPKPVNHILLTFPPRLLSAAEERLVVEWLGMAQNIVVAYISQRRSDDPMLQNRIVISRSPDRSPEFIVHSPNGVDCWLVSTTSAEPTVRRFETLRSALNSIWPVLPSTLHS